MKNKELTLLIMAGGLGSRFGGLKQIEAIGPNNEFITDYSIYDAILAGFTKVVFVIKKENLEIFENTIGKRIEGKIKVEYAFQESDIEYNGKTYTRSKPWGTAHAILSAKDNIKGNFLVINSDDFYGRDAYRVAANYLKEEHEKNEFAFVGYKVKNTLSENGSVKRGVCEESSGYLTVITESKVEEINNKIIATPLDSDNSFEVDDNSLVSMNMFLFTPYLFEVLEEKLGEFLDNNQDNLESCEYLIPTVVQELINENRATVKVLSTDSKWEGVTYKEDKEHVVESIKNLIEKGEYQENLWQK